MIKEIITFVFMLYFNWFLLMKVDERLRAFTPRTPDEGAFVQQDSVSVMEGDDDTAVPEKDIIKDDVSEKDEGHHGFSKGRYSLGRIHDIWSDNGEGVMRYGGNVSSKRVKREKKGMETTVPVVRMNKRLLYREFPFSLGRKAKVVSDM